MEIVELLDSIASLKAIRVGCAQAGFGEIHSDCRRARPRCPGDGFQQRPRKPEAAARSRQGAACLCRPRHRSPLALSKLRVRECANDLERAVAASRGRNWAAARVSRFTEDEELMIDAALEPLNPGKLKELLGREVFSSDRIAERRRAAAAGVEPSPRLRRLLGYVLRDEERGPTTGD